MAQGNIVFPGVVVWRGERKLLRGLYYQHSKAFAQEEDLDLDTFPLAKFVKYYSWPIQAGIGSSHEESIKKCSCNSFHVFHPPVIASLLFAF
jgi:hypothetical protein